MYALGFLCVCVHVHVVLLMHLCVCVCVCVCVCTCIIYIRSIVAPNYNCLLIRRIFHPQAVFQVYDTDNSGSISVDEFEMISSNFPFIQAFSELDMDK